MTLVNEIMIVAPYEKLARMAEEIAKHFPYSVGVQVSQSSQLKDDAVVDLYPQTRIFISRGGTAKHLRKATGRPVIEIPVTAYDVLSAISETARLGYKRIAIITPSNILIDSGYFVHITDLLLRFETGDDVAQISAKVQSILEQEEIDAIVGDRVAVQLAAQFGIHGQMLESGVASLQLALDMAVNVLNAQIEQQIKLEETGFILNVINESVVTTDRNGYISMLNKSAETVLNLSAEAVLGKSVTDSTGNDSLQQVMSQKAASENVLIVVNGKHVVLNHLPIIIDGIHHGAVGIFQEVKQIQKTELNIRQKLHHKGFIAKNTFSDIVTENEYVKKTIQLAKRYARSEGTVLIYGDTGTGKELFAQSIHNASRRAGGPFVSVNCAAIDGDLLNSELFGYDEGSFTGAVRGGRTGLFEMAHGGTLFLDEVSETSLTFQAKLLRVIQEREIRRVGGTRMIPVDVRIICATNRDLLQQVRAGKFREDLVYRLNVLELYLPPLKHRREDIIPIAVSCLNFEMDRDNKSFVWRDQRVFDPLLKYDWPGNIRELQNFVHRLLICCPTKEIFPEFVSSLFLETTTRQHWPEDYTKEGIEIPLAASWNEMESSLWAALLHHYGDDKEKLCQAYGISRTTLWRKLNPQS